MKPPSPLRMKTPSATILFSGKEIVRRVNRANRSILMKAGAFVRRSARQSLRKRKGISAPGKPPSSHTGRLKGLILFAFDAPRDSVVIGPNVIGSGDQPGATLEHGGVVVMKWRRRAKRTRFAARPFMGPALEKERPKFDKLWTNSVK